MESEPSTVGAFGSSVRPVLGGGAFASALRGGGTGGATCGGLGAFDRAGFVESTPMPTPESARAAASASALAPSTLRAAPPGTPDRRGGAGAREIGEGGGGGGGKRCTSSNVGSTGAPRTGRCEVRGVAAGGRCDGRFEATGRCEPDGRWGRCEPEGRCEPDGRCGGAGRF